MPQNRKITGFLLALLGIACAACAMAQGRDNQPRLVLQALDTDHDGKLSAAEIQAAPQTLLKLDRNGDGQITSDELTPRPDNAGATSDELVQQLMSFDKAGNGYLTRDELPARMQGIFDRGDANHDGKLTPDEIRTMANRQSMPAGPGSDQNRAAGMMRQDPLLNALDANHDGVISADEIANAGKELLTLDKNGDGEITPDEMRPRQQGPEDRVNHMLEEFDTNKDGKLSKAELPDGMQRDFDAIDKNHDGFLDRDELMQYFSTMGNGPRGGPPGGRDGQGGPGGPGGPPNSNPQQ
jgi:Ca2+-binding EF-hand superfamily protein